MRFVMLVPLVCSPSLSPPGWWSCVRCRSSRSIGAVPPLPAIVGQAAVTVVVLHHQPIQSIDVVARSLDVPEGGRVSRRLAEGKARESWSQDVSGIGGPVTPVGIRVGISRGSNSDVRRQAVSAGRVGPANIGLYMRKIWRECMGVEPTWERSSAPPRRF